MRTKNKSLIFGKYTPKEYADLLVLGVMEHKCQVEEGKGGYDYDDFLIRLDGYIEIYQIKDMVEAETLLGKKKCDGYEIGRVKVSNNYPIAPDDYDYEGEFEEKDLSRAVERAVRMYAEDEIHREIEELSTRAYAEELDQDREISHAG